MGTTDGKLGEIMDSETILIGHGLENDMNAMRLIHENIIDTSILFLINGKQDQLEDGV